MIGLLLLALATALLVGGAELFVENAAAAGRALGVSGLAVGLLLAGAEPEELVTAIVASSRGHPVLAAGDALGANVTMLTACLGLAALVRPLPLGRRVRGYAFAAAAAGAAAVVAVLGGRVTRAEGLLLVLGYVALVAVVWRVERQPPVLGELAELAEEDGDDDEQGDDGGGPRRPAVGLLLALAGVALMTAGGEAAVEGALRVEVLLGLRDTAVGLTVLALATTAELFALVLTALRRDVSELAVAGVVGSAAYNATATLGTAALIHPLPVGGALLPTAVAGALLPLVLVTARRGLGRPLGAVLLLGYAGYLAAVFA